MEIKLNREDLELIQQSLEYTKRSFQNCSSYPSYEFKQQRINEVDVVKAKISQMKKELTNANTN